MYQSNSHNENTPKADEGQGNGQSELSVSEANDGKGVALDTPILDKAPLENDPMIETAGDDAVKGKVSVPLAEKLLLK